MKGGRVHGQKFDTVGMGQNVATLFSFSNILQSSYACECRAATCYLQNIENRIHLKDTDVAKVMEYSDSEYKIYLSIKIIQVMENANSNNDF